MQWQQSSLDRLAKGSPANHQSLMRTERSRMIPSAVGLMRSVERERQRIANARTISS